MSQAASRASRLQSTVSTLVSGTPDIFGAAIVSDDGLMIASALGAETDEDSIGGMASILLSLGTRAAAELGLDDLEQVLIRASKGNVLMVKAGDGGVLLILMEKRAKLGLVFLDVKRAAAVIADLI